MFAGDPRFRRGWRLLSKQHIAPAVCRAPVVTYFPRARRAPSSASYDRGATQPELALDGIPLTRADVKRQRTKPDARGHNLSSLFVRSRGPFEGPEKAAPPLLLERTMKAIPKLGERACLALALLISSSSPLWGCLAMRARKARKGIFQGWGGSAGRGRRLAPLERGSSSSPCPDRSRTGRSLVPEPLLASRQQGLDVLEHQVHEPLLVASVLGADMRRYDHARHHPEGRVSG